MKKFFSILLCSLAALLFVLAPVVEPAFAATMSDGDLCVGLTTPENGGVYLGNWDVSTASGCGAPKTKICSHNPVGGSDQADFEEGSCCYVKWESGPSFLGYIYKTNGEGIYECKSNEVR
ncbi:MAG: hypothetical protein F6K56_22365 [Moorea sp. SIO3G5]|nr:hypothetical protein [Moorena sp. SIO3G5]